jgi:lipopolysaccharide/colanic/teichoic acid biosynthesis glycosyltransferase
MAHRARRIRQQSRIPGQFKQVAANLQLLGPRHEVPAGMTGWWQINGRSDIAPEQAVRLDAFYIENWSLAFDLYIVLKTISTVIERKGAY